MADISQLTLPSGTTYTLKDSSAVRSVDTALSASSTNPVQNQVITAALEDKADASDVYTKTEVDSMVSATYKAGGTIAFASLPALSSTYLGYVYNISDDFTTTSDFVEGAGYDHPAGTNVAIIVLSDGTTYKYDVMAGFIDLSDYEPKVIISTTEPTTVAEQYWVQDY